MLYILLYECSAIMITTNYVIVIALHYIQPKMLLNSKHRVSLLFPVLQTAHIVQVCCSELVDGYYMPSLAYHVPAELMFLLFNSMFLCTDCVSLLSQPQYVSLYSYILHSCLTILIGLGVPFSRAVSWCGA